MLDVWCHGVPVLLAAFFHKPLAIRLLNEKSSYNPIETDAFDTVIITIFFLFINWASFDGMPEVLRVHWDGLILGVRMAGGLKKSGLSGITHRCALWYITCPDLYIFSGNCVQLDDDSSLTTHRADLATAMILKEKLRLCPPYPEISLFDYFGLHSAGTSCLATAFGARIHIYTGSKELSQAVSTAFWGLRSVSELKSMRKMEAFVDTAGLDDIQYSDRTSALERVLVPLWRVRNKECRRAGFVRIFAWTALIYIYSELRDAPRGMALYGRLAERIREEMLEDHELKLMYVSFPYLMLWILFVAGRTTSAESNFYFAKEAAKILAAQEVIEDVDIVQASQAFLWPTDRKTPVDSNSVRKHGKLPLLMAAGAKVPV